MLVLLSCFNKVVVLGVVVVCPENHVGVMSTMVVCPESCVGVVSARDLFSLDCCEFKCCCVRRQLRWRSVGYEAVSTGNAMFGAKECRVVL